jgi:hypothetical protein
MASTSITRGTSGSAVQNPPSQVLKLTGDGKKVLLRIGREEATSSNDTGNLAGPTGLLVDSKTNELDIADGYRNRRVVVFDAETGAYKRHWGAYGRRPPEGGQGVSLSRGNTIQLFARSSLRRSTA